MASVIPGILGIAPAATVTGVEFPQIIPGPTGPTGPKGQAGGTIYPQSCPPPCGSVTGYNNLDIWLDVETGDMYQLIHIGHTNVWTLVGNVEGPTGPTGPRGKRGERGCTGPRGRDGCDGERGCPGRDGDKGRSSKTYSFIGTTPTMVAETGDLAIGQCEAPDGSSLTTIYHKTDGGWTLGGTIRGYPCSKSQSNCPPLPFPPLCPPLWSGGQCYPGCQCFKCSSSHSQDHVPGCKCSGCSSNSCNPCNPCEPQEPCNISYMYNLRQCISVQEDSLVIVAQEHLAIKRCSTYILNVSASGIMSSSDTSQPGITFQVSIKPDCGQKEYFCGILEGDNCRWLFNMTRHVCFDHPGNYRITTRLITYNNTSITIDPFSSSANFLTITLT